VLWRALSGQFRLHLSAICRRPTADTVPRSQPVPQKKDEAWVEVARRQLTELCLPVQGKLTIARSKAGFIEVKASPRGPGSSVTLPFRWSEQEWGNAYTRVRNVFTYWVQGHPLKAAAELAQGRAPSNQRDWQALVEAFRKWKSDADTGITQTTWQHSYEPVLSMARELLASKTPPLMAQPLMLACVQDWRTGSRMRQIRVRSLAGFLSYCVEQHHLPEVWEPPKNLKPLIGAVKPSEAVHRKADAFASDQQILDLLNSLPTDSGTERDRVAAGQWRDATQLLAELGLRPVELLYLQLKTNKSDGKKYWWCSYQKKGGNGATEPRRIEPLPLKSNDGVVQEWNLKQRWEAGLISLPPLKSGNGAAECWKTYFNRRPYWISLKQQMLQLEGTRLTSYSFRHSYSVRGHRADLTAALMAASMGHGLQTHCQHYPYVQEQSTAAAFEAARARLALG